MRTVKKTIRAVSAPIDDLMTFRAFPTREIDQLDPFLFLNHHGPQFYGKNNHGLPFGPHPHRGFETLTFILTGDLVHWDSGGSKKLVKEGGIQWMTAGSGLIHSETSSEKFKEEGGRIEILQLWMNLPGKLKSLAPSYQGFEKDELPVVTREDGKIRIQVISGEIDGTKGPAESVTGLTMTCIQAEKGAEISLEVPRDSEILFYVVEGAISVNGSEAVTHDLVTFSNDHTSIRAEITKETRIIFGFGKPLGEPVVAYGPFVMNTEEEIRQAYADYQQGKMGRWEN